MGSYRGSTGAILGLGRSMEGSFYFGGASFVRNVGHSSKTPYFMNQAICKPYRTPDPKPRAYTLNP